MGRFSDARMTAGVRKVPLRRARYRNAPIGFAPWILRPLERLTQPLSAGYDRTTEVPDFRMVFPHVRFSSS